MVGDWPTKDIDGAKSMGMKTAFAKYGATKETTSKADFELKNIGQLLRILNEK